MSGYLSGVLVAYLLNLIIAYAVFLPGAGGILNLGVAGFVAIGAYASAWLSNEMEWPLAVTILLSMGVSALIGLAISFPILRTRGVYMVLATIAFGEVVVGLLINVEAIGGAAGYPVFEFIDLPVIALCTLAVVLFVVWLMSTRFGLALRAIHDDEPVAALFGVSVRGVRVAAFTIGAAIAGLGGALYGHHYAYVDVIYFTTLVSIYTLLYVLIGGVQTPWGPIVGAAVFSLLPELFRGATEWRYVFFAAVIILIMAVRPEGIITRALLLRLKRRGTIAAPTKEAAQ
ncbi:branched-chain amino acid ABC transporter permease [Alphaproteobacteria bacterium KMM 3653]|uniref:Branched-chain amino acid ABC transporter permease n=1 Tax=Harenicola maris TaxID=2841044 RepID=A0AAP2G3V2_9RHOB|nr:branched-chain amino acid ABC transporter permease [Harenicola maris]